MTLQRRSSRSRPAISLFLFVTVALNIQAQHTDTNPHTVLLKHGQVLEMSLTKSLNSRRAKVGDDMVLKLTKPLIANGATVLPANWAVHGRVTDVKPAEKNCQPGAIHWEFSSLTMRDGKTIEIRSMPEAVAKSRFRAAIPQETRTSENTAAKPSRERGASVGSIAKDAAAGTVVILILSLRVLAEIRGWSGNEGCAGGKGQEAEIRKGSAFYAEISNDMELIQ